MKRPFISLWLVACCLFGCLAALEGYGKRQEADCGQKAADLKVAADRIRQGTMGTQTVICASSDLVSALDTGTSIHHLRRLDESEAFQSRQMRAEGADTTLQSMYPPGRFLANGWPVAIAGPVQVMVGNKWMTSFFRMADWLESGAGTGLPYGMLNGF